jgi:hypothetical protein
MLKVLYFSLKQSSPVGDAGCAMMMMVLGTVQGLVHIGRDFSTGLRMWQGFDIM